MGGMWRGHSEQSVQQYHSLGGQLTYMNACVCVRVCVCVSVCLSEPCQSKCNSDPLKVFCL